jgi:hypothetical protein
MRISFKFCNEQLNEIKKWKSVQVVYEDFKIENNFISKFEPSKETIIFHPLIQSLVDYCFSGRSSLTSITLPSSLQSLGNSCFNGCESLTSINFPLSLQSIGKNCFFGCYKLPAHIENQFLIQVSKITNSVNSISGSLSHKIETVQTSQMRISFNFCNEQLNKIKKWKSIQVI